MEGGTSDTANLQHFLIRTDGKPAGLLLDLVAAQPMLPGSEDVTIVTLEAGDRTFSFATPDNEKGPVYVPDFHAYVTLASDARNFSPSIVKAGEKIREKLAKEPEQTYERASWVGTRILIPTEELQRLLREGQNPAPESTTQP